MPCRITLRMLWVYIERGAGETRNWTTADKKPKFSFLNTPHSFRQKSLACVDGFEDKHSDHVAITWSKKTTSQTFVLQTLTLCDRCARLESRHHLKPDTLD